MGRGLIRGYDLTVAPATQLLVKHVLRLGTIFYGGNFAVRREALAAIGGFDTSIEFHGEDTNLGRRLFRVGKVGLYQDCWLYTSARRYVAMGKRRRDPALRPQLRLGAAAPPPEGRHALGCEAVMPGYDPFLLCDFHVHTRWSDGRLTVREVVDLYGQTGKFDVIAITDHILMKKDLLANVGGWPRSASGASGSSRTSSRTIWPTSSSRGSGRCATTGCW